MTWSRVMWGAIASAAMLLGVVSTAPAVAQTHAWTDPAADMWIGWDEWEPAPDADNADIRQVSIHHRPRALVINLTYTDLRWEYGYLMPLEGTIRTNERKTRIIDIIRFDGASDFRVRVFTANYDPIRCGATGAVDLHANSATMRIPRTCLSSPRWVRANLAAESQRPNPDGPDFKPPNDNAMNTGPYYSSQMEFTPRIYRG